MDIGIPREVHDLDQRVGLGTNTVKQLTEHGHAVYVQTGAGDGAGFNDEAFIEAGATIVYSAEEVYKRSRMVCRVTTPTLEEIDEMAKRHALIQSQESSQLHGQSSADPLPRYRVGIREKQSQRAAIT